jgi:heme-degrading monooxygenase HmoA|tara:strand:- start:2428 stop:2760 length:333 start_codon:yes stop_codon:yes gene_type:complete
MSHKIKKVFIETVVCGAAKGKGARFLRMLETRQAFKRRQDGCLAAWVANSTDGTDMVLVQTVFNDRQAWKKISDEVLKVLDAKDGGLESVVAGPPLIGMFEIDPRHLKLE